MNDFPPDIEQRLERLRQLAAYLRFNSQLPVDPEAVAGVIEHNLTWDMPRRAAPAITETPVDKDDTRDFPVLRQDEMDTP